MKTRVRFPSSPLKAVRNGCFFYAFLYLYALKIKSMKQLVVVVFALLLSYVGNTQVTPTKLYISSVNNLIKVGPLTGNTNLSFGVKNVLEEATQDKGYSIVKDRWDADLVLDIDIIYFDVEKTKSNISVFHKDENAVVIRMRGQVTKDGQIIKDALVEDSSSEIVASTGIVATDGKFNSTVSRNAIKKTCVLVVSKLF
jgi:hypothetical protein